METHLTIMKIIFHERVPFDHLTSYPFSVTIHQPDSFPLSVREAEVIKESIVNAAHKIKEMRGNASLFNWTQNGAIDWDRDLYGMDL